MDKLPLALKGKNGPAVFNIHNSYDALIRPYAADYDIDTKSLESDYSTASVHEDENGKVKYIDSVINTGNIYYNKTLWSEAGLTDADIPTTWDEFIQVAQKLTKTDGSKMTQAGFNFNGDAYSAIYQGLNYQKGELLFSEDGKKANYNNDVTKKTCSSSRICMTSTRSDPLTSATITPKASVTASRDDLRLGPHGRHAERKVSRY